MTPSMACVRCGRTANLSMRFCPQCGNPLFIDLSRKDLTGDMFPDVLSSVYNLIITEDNQERDAYFHPVSRSLIHKRYELEHKCEIKDSSGILSPRRYSGSAEAINFRINSRSSNALTGYATRVTEEMIVKKRTPPLSASEVEKGIISFKRQYGGEHIVKNISANMSDYSEERRILFIFYIQDDNKHMDYFLDEPMLQRWRC